MSKTGGTATQTTQTAPAEFQQPFIDLAFNEAKGLFEMGTPEFFPSSLTAPLTGDELAGQDLARTAATGSIPKLLEGTNLAFGRALAGPETILQNPAAISAGNALVDPIFRNLSEQILPNIRGGAIAVGQPGGSRQSLAENRAVETTVRGASEALDRFFGNLLTSSMQSRSSAIAQLPQIAQSQALPAELLSAVGGQTRAFDQAQIDEDIQRFNFGENIPFQALREFSNLVTAPLGSTTSAATTAPERGTPEQITGALATLLPLLSRLFGF